MGLVTQPLCWHRINESGPGMQQLPFIQMLVQHIFEAFYEPKTKRLMVKMAGAGKKAYYHFTKEGGKGSLRENLKLTGEITFALGKPAEDKLVQQRQDIRETNQKLKEAKQEDKKLNETIAKQQQTAQQLQAKEVELEQINQRIENIKNEGGTQMEIENETDSLKRRKAKLERDIETAKKKKKRKRNKEKRMTKI